MAKTTKSEVAKEMGIDIGPSLYLSDKNYSGISKLNIGETVTMTITAKVQSVSQNAYGGKTSKNASLCITKIDGKAATKDTVDSEEYDEED